MLPLSKKFTLNDLRGARSSGTKVPMLTCYDYSTARVMQEAGVSMLLVGDSAANVILGHETTIPVSLEFMIELTAAVRRGAPLALVVGDMPFGSYQASPEQAARNVFHMVQKTGCDIVKLEVAGTTGHVELIRRVADAGVAVMAHIGLRPQAVGVLGGYKYQGRTADEACAIVASALQMQEAGAVAILLEAVPPEVSKAVVDATRVPIVGCGAGPACHSCVIVTHDGIGLTTRRPRFAPDLGNVAASMSAAFGEYVRRVTSGEYPAPEHDYEISPEERAKFEKT
ncbi:MAG: 3-methyl-2-oxobutanoate hydroxymethyltransferase [Tepidisphaeraceae bacterium]